MRLHNTVSQETYFNVVVSQCFNFVLKQKLIYQAFLLVFPQPDFANLLHLVTFKLLCVALNFWKLESLGSSAADMVHAVAFNVLGVAPLHPSAQLLGITRIAT